MSIVRDMSLAEYGRMKIAWVQDFMPALSAIRARFEKEKPFAGKKITMSINMEAKRRIWHCAWLPAAQKSMPPAATPCPLRTMWLPVWLPWASTSTAGTALLRKSMNPTSLPRFPAVPI